MTQELNIHAKLLRRHVPAPTVPKGRDKEKDRQKIAKDTEEFLARGGRIKNLPENLSRFTSIKYKVDHRGVPTVADRSQKKSFNGSETSKH